MLQARPRRPIRAARGQRARCWARSRRSTYSEESVPFATGDTVLLYTDGVTEARSGNRFFGEERVEEALSPGGTAAEVVDRLQASVRRFVQAALRDDVAVLAVEVARRRHG